jgi:hypothetical protein
MAGLIWYNGGLLFVGGGLTTDPNCCCTGCNTSYETLYGRWINRTGDAVGLPDTFTLTKVPGACSPLDCLYQGEPGSMAMGECDSEQMYILLRCQDPGGWSISPAASGGFVNGTAGFSPATLESDPPLLIAAECEFTPSVPSTCEGTARLEVRGIPW